MRIQTNRTLLTLGMVALLLLGNSCRTLRELKSFAKCQFRIDTVRNIRLAGVDVQNIRSFDDLTFTKAAKVTGAYMTGRLPLTFTLNVQVKNPNEELAALNRLQWIAEYEGIQLASGNVTQRVAIQPNGGVATLPLQVTCDLRDVMRQMEKSKVLGSAFELADENQRPKRVSLRLKPSISVGKNNRQVDYPGYITVKKDFTAR